MAEWLRHGKVGQPRRDRSHGNTIIAQNKNTSDVTSQVQYTSTCINMHIHVRCIMYVHVHLIITLYGL